MRPIAKEFETSCWIACDLAGRKALKSLKGYEHGRLAWGHS